MQKFDFSQKMSKEIILIDKETFGEINLNEKELIGRFKNNDTYILYVRYVEDEPAGFIGIMKANTPHYSGWWIDLLAVRPLYQGKGIGREMVAFIKEIYFKEGKVITALVKKNNISSIKSFENNNFVEEKDDFKLFILSK